ncbi:GTPase Era, mitochondrial-like [Scylla paramamosain]|uniref:GTPase Era, mitochondrial-like n=1 Tax=Scylla paramamosain TaxID=85552 RepID=UPI0030828A46
MIRQLVVRGASEALCRCQASLSTFHALSARTRGNDDIWERAYQQTVPRTMEEMTNLLKQEVVSPPNSHLLKVAIVGMPNCGKSTLVNKLMGWKVCSSSQKVHTTQVNARAVYNIGSTQMVFLDTPGLVSPQEVARHKLQRNLLTEPELSLQEADLLAVVHDISCHFTHSNLHSRLVRLLALHPTIPAVLVLNKVDLLKSKGNLLHITRILTEGVIGGRRFFHKTERSGEVKKEVLIRRALLQEKFSASQDQPSSQPHLYDNDSVNRTCESENGGNIVQTPEVGEGRDNLLNTAYDISHIKESDILAGRVHLTEHQVQTFVKDRRSWPLFDDVFMISAQDGTGVDDLRDFLLSCAQPQPWIFSPKVVTDQKPEEIALMTVREKFLEQFKEEIPYTLKFSIEYWELTETELLSIIVKVQCVKKGLVRVLLGNRGSIIASMAQKAEQDLRNIFRSEVKLRLNVVYDRFLKRKIANR